MAAATMIPDMKKKPETTSFAIRLPVVVVEELDLLAESNFESRAGMVSRIVLDWLKANRTTKPNHRKAKD